MRFDSVSRWMRCRALMLLCICFSAGVLLGYWNMASAGLWAAGLTAFLAALLLCRKAVLIFPSALLLGALLTSCELIPPKVAPQEDVMLCGRVVSEANTAGERTRVLLDDVSADGKALCGRVMLYLYVYDEEDAPAPIEYGSLISVRANTYLPSGITNPHGYDYAAYLRRQGAFLAASGLAADASVSPPKVFSLRGAAIRLRKHLNSVIDKLYDEECAPLVSALLLGDRSMLPEEMSDRFRTAGLAHLLAISGLHISCLAAALDWLLRKARLKEGAVFAAVGLFLSAYAFLVGCPVSILRAVIMYGLAASARLFGRPSDTATNLSLTAAIILLFCPLSIGDPSMILSFGSVAGLILLTKSIAPAALLRVHGILHTPIRALTLALAGSLSAQILTLPALAALFGEVPLYSLLANLPAIPLLTISLPFAMLSAALGCISLPLGSMAAAPVGWALSCLNDFADAVASLPGALIRMPCWPLGITLFFGLLCAAGSTLSRVRRRLKKVCLMLIPAVVLCACLYPLTYPTEGLEVLFFDAGQADAALIRAEDQYYLMDTGEDSTAARYLARSGIRPSGVFLSHPHTDHAGGLGEIVEVCPPAVIYVPCLWDDVPADEGVPELLHKAEEKGWIVRMLRAGDEIALSDHVAARVYQPWEGMTEEGNGASLVMSVSLGSSSVLFTGDLPTEDEYAFLPDCDVLKVPHHGAKSSTDALLLQMTSPSVAVVSVGRNSYGHPAVQTLERLREAGAAVWRTDECGAISVLLDGEGGIRVESFVRTVR